MNGDAPAAPPAVELVFAPSEHPAGARRALGVLVGVSLLGHALGFYVLQAFYTPAGALPPTPLRAGLTLATAGTPEAAALNRWLAVADPALGAGATLPRPANILVNLPPVPYVPSFQVRSPLAGLGDLGAEPVLGGASSPPSVLPPRPVLPPREVVAPPPPTAATRTRVVLPEVLRRRLPAGEMPPPGPLAMPEASLTELPRPTTFLVGVRPEGGPPLVFREEPSGVTTADETARSYLENLPFTPDERANLVWGRVTVFWGREAFR